MLLCYGKVLNIGRYYHRQPTDGLLKDIILDVKIPFMDSTDSQIR